MHATIRKHVKQERAEYQYSSTETLIIIAS
jgi:hypothetical protein